MSEECKTQEGCSEQCCCTKKDDTSQGPQEPAAADFDTTGKARLKALENAAVKLSEALREVSEYTVEEDNPTLHLKKSLVTQNIALRNTRQCLEDLNNLMAALLNDLVLMIQALAYAEESQARLASHIDTIQATLVDAGLLTEEQLQKTFKEKILPLIIAKANEKSRKREDQTSEPTAEVDRGK